MKTRRVVVTGIGAVTPLGNNVRDTWEGLKQGASGVGQITLFDAQSFSTKIAGEVKNFDFSKWIQKDPKLAYCGRNSRFAIVASSEAMADARLNGGVDPERIGIYFGAGDGGFDFSEYSRIIADAMKDTDESIDAASYMKESIARMHPQAVIEQEPSQVVNHLAHLYRVKGPVSNCLTACAASSQAVGESLEIIRRNQADIMITGGTHSMVHPLGVAGFVLLTTLSTRNDAPQEASRPFDKNRDGFVLSEGSAVLILEELEHAKNRGAKIYAELAGYGMTSDAHRLTDPHPEGRGAIAAMRMALKGAGIKPHEIDYINAHGTSTRLNDQIETYAIKRVFGDDARRIPVSSNKSMLGHLIAAAGAVELISSILTIREGIVPPTINYQTPDETCDLDYVPNQARAHKVNTILSNSFGFGGQNSVLVAKKWENS